MKHIRSKEGNTYYIVIEETPTQYCIIQQMKYEGIGYIQLMTWCDKRMFIEEELASLYVNKE